MRNEKKLLKALVLGGSIATGITLGTTTTFAAEIDENHVYADDATNAATSNAQMNEMVADADAIEAGANTVENTVDEARELVEAHEMNDQTAKEQSEEISTTIENINEKKKAVKKNHEKVEMESIRAASKYRVSSQTVGLIEYSDRTNATNNKAEKITIIDEAIAACEKAKEEAPGETVTRIVEHTATEEELADVNRRLDIALENHQKAQKEYMRLTNARSSYNSYTQLIAADEAQMEKFRQGTNPDYNQLEISVYGSAEGYYAHMNAEIEKYKKYREEQRLILESGDLEAATKEYEETTAIFTDILDERTQLKSGLAHVTEIRKDKKYDEFITAAQDYKTALTAEIEADVVLERAENGAARAVAAQTEFNNLLASAEETEEPAVEETEEPVAEETEETETPVVEETETPVVEETETPVVEETEEPVVEETETPVAEETEEPVAEETEAPVTEETETPAAEETETPVAEETETPAVEETEAPVAEETEAPVAETAEETFSEDVYKIYNTLKTIYNENPEVAEKVNALAKNDKVVTAAKFVYSNATVSMVNQAAKQAVNYDINAENVNAVLDVATNFVNE